MDIISIKINEYWVLALILVAWDLAWKGVALWKAAHNDSKPWFIGLLIINSLGILPILYIYVFGQKQKSHKA